jgi:hypothetical protein
LQIADLFGETLGDGGGIDEPDAVLDGIAK